MKQDGECNLEIIKGREEANHLEGIDPFFLKFCVCNFILFFNL